jgi:hypothetical protein
MPQSARLRTFPTWLQYALGRQLVGTCIRSHLCTSPRDPNLSVAILEVEAGVGTELIHRASVDFDTPQALANERRVKHRCQAVAQRHEGHRH